MAINVFEGARRIALIFAFLWVIACTVFAFDNATKVARFYTIAEPGAKPVLNEKQACGDGDANYFTSRTVPYSGELSIVLCFTSYAQEGKRIIPYADAKPEQRYNETWRKFQKTGLDDAKVEELEKAIVEAGDEQPVDVPKIKKLIADYNDYTGGYKAFAAGTAVADEITRYTTLAGARFELPSEDVKGARTALWKNHVETAGITLLFILGGWLAGWVLMKAAGWVVRGFLGIPMGKDART